MKFISTLQEYILLIRAGYCIDEQQWTFGERHFVSRESAVDHLRFLSMQEAIRRSLQNEKLQP
jgi:hypothetical protein